MSFLWAFILVTGVQSMICGPWVWPLARKAWRHR